MAERSMENRKRYQKRIEAKQCGNCGAVLTDTHKRTCDACLTRVAHWGQRTRAQRREAGKCPHCGAEKAKGKKLCSDCLRDAKGRYQKRKSDGVCVLCGAKPQEVKTKCRTCAEKTALRTRNWRDRLIVEVMNAYGGCVCRCCGENEVAFLSIDHVNGGGRKHRAVDKTGDIYSWLKRSKFPEGFQVLCMNCNWAKGKYGICPHEKRRLEAML